MDRSRRSNRPLVRAAALVLLVGLLLGLVIGPASCTNDDSSDDPTPTTEPPESEVEAAYLAYWQMADRLAEAPDPQDPELPRRASGQALTELREGLTSLKEASNRLDVRPRASHTVSEVQVGDSETATLVDCDVDDSRLLNADGDVVDEGLTTTLWEVQLVMVESNWLVDRFTRVEAWEGETDCT